jgi:hypothetical protein
MPNFDQASSLQFPKATIPNMQTDGLVLIGNRLKVKSALTLHFRHNQISFGQKLPHLPLILLRLPTLYFRQFDRVQVKLSIFVRVNINFPFFVNNLCYLFALLL